MTFGKVFPQASKEERHRFDLLKRAYVDVRYSGDYRITKEDLEHLSGRVELLCTLTEQICKEKIAGFTK
jgi:hypothetical protein